jgi:lipid A ethanolaminephosphotransferase
LPELIRNAGKDDLVIVLHQKGSHGPAYCKALSAAFRPKFGPVCQTNELERYARANPIVAAYDNTILYTDHVISKPPLTSCARPRTEEG